MVKDVFGMSHLKLTGTDNSDIFLNAVDIKAILGLEFGSDLWVVSGGCQKEVFCKEMPLIVVDKINELADKQEKFHEELEAEAKAKAQERFFDKYPKAKAALEEEVKEQQEQQ